MAFSSIPLVPPSSWFTDSYIADTGGSGIAAAISVKPAAGVTASIMIEHTRIENNFFGIVADGSAGGIIRGVVRDSVISANTNNGITVSTTSSKFVLTVDNTTITGNAYGLVAAGANAGMLIRRSIINSNANRAVLNRRRRAALVPGQQPERQHTTDGAFTGFVNTQ